MRDCISFSLPRHSTKTSRNLQISASSLLILLSLKAICRGENNIIIYLIIIIIQLIISSLLISFLLSGGFRSLPFFVSRKSYHTMDYFFSDKP